MVAEAITHHCLFIISYCFRVRRAATCLESRPLIIIIIKVIIIITKYDNPKTWKANLFKYFYT